MRRRVLVELAVLVFRQVVGFDSRVGGPGHEGSESSEHNIKLSHLIQNKFDIPFEPSISTEAGITCRPPPHSLSGAPSENF